MSFWSGVVKVAEAVNSVMNFGLKFKASKELQVRVGIFFNVKIETKNFI